MGLKDYKTEELINEIRRRQEIRESVKEDEELIRVTVRSKDGRHERYINTHNKTLILLYEGRF